MDKLPSDRATVGLPTGGTVTEEMEPKTPQEMENGRHTSVYLLVLTSVLSHCLPVGQVYQEAGGQKKKIFPMDQKQSRGRGRKYFVGD